MLQTPDSARTTAATQTPTPTSPSGGVSATRTPAPPTPPTPAGSPTLAFPDLNGVWVDNGHLIVIAQDGLNVSAAYVEERLCDHGDETGASTPYRHDFNAILAQEGEAWSLTAENMASCAWGFDPSLNGVRLTSMRAVLSADFNSISGDWYADVVGEWNVDDILITRQLGAPTPEGFSFPDPEP